MDTRDSLPIRSTTSVPRPSIPAGSTPEKAATASKISGRLILRGLARYWWQVLIVWLIACGSLGGAIFLKLKPSYEAAALLRVEPGVTDLFGVLSARGDMLTFIETQVNLIRSTNVLAAATHDPRVAGLPRIRNARDATVELRDALGVAAVRETYLIRVSLRSESAAEAATIVSAVVDAYINANAEWADGMTVAQISKLEAAQRTLEAQAEEKRRRWRLLSMKNSDPQLPVTIVEGEESTTTAREPRAVTMEEYKEVQRDLRRVNLELISAEALLSQRQSEVESAVGPEAKATPEAGRASVERWVRDSLRADPGLNELRGELGRIDDQIADVRRKARQSSDPALIHLKRRQADLTAQWGEEIADKERRLRESLRGRETAPVPEPVSDLPALLRNAREQVATLRATRSRLESELKQIEVTGREEAGDSVDIYLVQSDLDDIHEMQASVGKRLEQLKFEARGEARVSVADAAVPPQRPVSDKRLKMTAASAVGALGVLLSLVLLLEIRSGRISHPDELASSVRAEVFTVPQLPMHRRSQDEGERNERVDELVQRIDHLRVALCGEPLDGVGRCVLITSAIGSEGKTSLASQLAMRCAGAGLSTVLIDADLRRPRLSDLLGVPSTPGMTDALLGRVGVEEALVPIARVDGFHLLPAGTPLADPSQVLRSAQLSQLIGHLRQVFDIVIIDTPPVLPVPDALSLGIWADGAILATRSDTSRRALVERADRMLATAGIPVLGVVVNGVRGPAMNYGGYASYYRSSHPQAPTPEPVPEPTLGA